MSAYDFSIDPVKVPKIETANRRIATEIPAPGTVEILKKLDKFESRSMHGQLPLVWDHAIDYNVFDFAGNKWIDFTSTIFVANVGHSNPRVLSALNDSITKPLLGCYAYPTENRATYLKRLVEFAGKPFEKAFLLSAGTEATEAAFKLMRMHGQKQGKKRLGIITIGGNWHGRTLGAQMMASNPVQKDWIGNIDPDIHHIPFPYPWDVSEEEAEKFLMASLNSLSDLGINMETDICGVMLETFQGWGAIFYPKNYVKAFRKLTSRLNILLAFDEMQSGFGRTGKNFGFMHYEVEPDLICCGKGMGGGLPLSGVVGRAEIMDLPDVGNMSSTHSGNPMLCAVGLAVLEELEEKNLVVESQRKGLILNQLLEEIKSEFQDQVERIICKGLIASIMFKVSATGAPDSETASKVSELCMQKGLLVVHTGRESIKLGPPLTISDSALIEGVSVLRESIFEVLNG
jgi:4-aminobutyrate aminotransferase-like enzyme